MTRLCSGYHNVDTFYVSLATIYIDFVMILNCIMNCFIILNDQYLKGLHFCLSKQCAAGLLDLVKKIVTCVCMNQTLFC